MTMATKVVAAKNTRPVAGVWQRLWEEDPTEAAKIDRKLRGRRETISQAQKKLRDHQQSQFQFFSQNS